jgi:hypothetical protein
LVLLWTIRSIGRTELKVKFIMIKTTKEEV